jgi:hypothetical protein
LNNQKSEEIVHTGEQDLLKTEQNSPAGEKECIQDLKKELEKMTLQHNQCIKKIKTLEKTVEFLHSRRLGFSTADNYSGNEKKYDSDFKNMYAFRLGDLLIKAVTRPGKNTVFLPLRLVKLVWEYANRNKTIR